MNVNSFFRGSGQHRGNSAKHRMRLLVVILPDRGLLEKSADSARGRQLFDRQLNSYERVLDGAVHQDIAAAWALMKRLRSAVTQEKMQAAAS